MVVRTGTTSSIAEAAASLELHRAAVEAGGIFAKACHVLERRHGLVFWVEELLCWHLAVEMKLKEWLPIP